MEPAVHIGVGGVVECPLRARCCTDCDRDEVYGEHCRQNEEADDASSLAAPGKLIYQDKCDEHNRPTDPLEDGVVAIDLE